MDVTLFLSVTTQDEWRSRLAEHHASACEVWLPFYEKHTGLPARRKRTQW